MNINTKLLLPLTSPFLLQGLVGLLAWFSGFDISSEALFVAGLAGILLGFLIWILGP